ncbi:hypothetical protein ACE4RR_09645 [Alteribacillus sp. HJP-4]
MSSTNSASAKLRENGFSDGAGPDGVAALRSSIYVKSPYIEYRIEDML